MRRQVFAANDWGDTFDGIYRDQSRRTRERRHRRRAHAASRIDEAELTAAQQRIRARFNDAKKTSGFAATIHHYVYVQACAGDRDARLLQRAVDRRYFSHEWRSRRAFLRAKVNARRKDGFAWPGGNVGGNPVYWRAPFTCPGLASDDHPILKLFVASTPGAARLRTGDDKVQAIVVGNKLLALDDAYVETNPAMRRVLRVEVDAVFPGGFAALTEAVKACGVLPPNIVVGHVDAQGSLHHPHLLWLIADPVSFTDRSRRAPQNAWRAVLRGLTASLLPIGADPGGMNNALRTKNPVSPQWHRAILAETPYCLQPDPRDGAPGYLALMPGCDLRKAGALLRRATQNRCNKAIPTDHPHPAMRVQSNAAFRSLSELARQRVGWYRDEGRGTQEDFLHELTDAAVALVTAGSDHRRDVERAAASIARNVAAWTWKNYRQRPAKPRCATPEERRARQAAGQAKAAESRHAATRQKLIEAARSILAAGNRLTKAAVIRATGKSEGTVRDHWPDVLAALRTPPASGAARVSENHHVWTAPWMQGRFGRDGAAVGCGHVSGLDVRCA